VYFETLLTHVHDASQSHLTSALWHSDEGDFLAHNPPNDASNRGYQARWKITNKSAEIEMYVRVHGDLFNVPRLLLRRLYFLNSDRSKYVCLGFYPNRGYRAFFELGGVRHALVVLPPSLIPSLAFHLPKVCNHLLRGEQYKCNEMFRT